ncbi:MAG: LacI family transcriptional regulator [Bacilli bacterium]|nr:LacI family transcriptional regulator [Bacilli bacterium]
MKMEDIARMANVSKASVSLALSGKPGIGPDTRERILKIAKETGYVLNLRSDARTEVRSLQLLVFTNSGIVLEHYYKQPFFMELIHFIEERCRSRGYSLLFSAVDIEYFERDIRSVMEESRRGGVVLLGTNLSQQQIAHIAEIQPNLVVLDTCYETLNVNCVVMNNRMGAYQAAAYLYQQGHRQIGYVQSNARMYNFESRKRGMTEALQEYGLTIEERDFFSLSPAILAAQDVFKQQLLERRKQGVSQPTALFCECDYMAISVIKSLNELGIRVPDDLSVMGFDNISEAVIISPELTTIHVEKEKMAHQAVDLLIETIENEESIKIKSLIDTRLIERKSCKSIV